MPQSLDVSTPTPQRTFLGHPVGLAILFLTQMWERFSYFGMLALLILYLNQYFKLPQEDSSSIFKWYTSLIYFTPLIGGYLADRLLGNKRAVLLGVALMAVGHFLMAFPLLNVLYAALVFLVVGCGLLTPPLTSQVGLLYPPNDPRRDSAYTIYYMGINLGAFVSPLACGWLVDNTRGGFHSGFTLAGIGMVIALATYLVGLPWIVEIPQQPGSARPAAAPASEAIQAAPSKVDLTSEEVVEKVPSVLPRINWLAPRLLAGIGVLLAVAAPGLAVTNVISWDTVISLELAAVCFLMFAWVTASVRGGMRDRVLAILLLGVFSVFYWAGAGQYGNAINLWADQHTDRYLTGPAPAPDLFPEAAASAETSTTDAGPMGFWERWINLFRLLPKKQADQETGWGEWWSGLWNPMPTPWFQSINPLLILLLAPMFAVLWTWLDRQGLNPPLPVKMGLGLVLMALAFGLMLVASYHEGQPSSVHLQGGKLPDAIGVNERRQLCRVEEGRVGEPYAAGRLFHTTGSLRTIGAFPDTARDEIVRDTAPPDFVQKIKELQEKTAELAKGAPGWTAQVQLDQEPPGLDLRYAGFGEPTGNQDVRYDPATRTLTATIVLEDKEIKGLRTAAGDLDLRVTLNKLMAQASTTRVSPWWLLGFFLLATLGELCLSPVGLSMVSQLAPPRFATMLMGLWLLTFAFGNFLAGAFGEKWGTWGPFDYFLMVLAVLGCASVVLFGLVRKIGALMHEKE